MENEKDIKEVHIKANEDGLVNLIEIWQLTDLDDDFDPAKYFEETGTRRLMLYLEDSEELDKDEVVKVDMDGRSIWVHPLLMLKYMAWCQPGMMMEMLDLFHEYNKHQAKKNKTETRH